MSASGSSRPTLRRVLAGTALVLGVGALGSGVGTPGSGVAARGGGMSVAALSAAVDEGVPTVGAVELAHWLRDRRPGLLLADLRPRADFDLFHLPGAVHATIPGLVAEGPPGSPETLVLVAGGLDAAAAWPILKAGGRSGWVLDGGVEAWFEQILSPVLPAFADSALAARFAEVSELSRYFGGEPRVAEPGEAVTTPWAVDDTASTTTRIEGLRARGGCGW